MEPSAERLPLLARPKDVLDFIYETGRQESGAQSSEPYPPLGASSTQNAHVVSAIVTATKTAGELSGLRQLLSRHHHHRRTVPSALNDTATPPPPSASYETRVALTQEAGLLARAVVARVVRAQGTPEQRYRRALIGLLPTAQGGVCADEAAASHAAGVTEERSTDDTERASMTPAPAVATTRATTMAEWPYTTLPDVTDTHSSVAEDAERRRLLRRYERCCTLCHVTPMPCVQGCLAPCEEGTGRPRWIAEVPAMTDGDTNVPTPAATAVAFVTSSTTATNASPTTSLATPTTATTTTTTTAERGLLSSSASPQTTMLASDGAVTTSSTVASAPPNVALRVAERDEGGGAATTASSGSAAIVASGARVVCPTVSIQEEVTSPCCRSSLNDDTLCACSSPSMSTSRVPSSQSPHPPPQQRPSSSQAPHSAHSTPCTPLHTVRLALSVGHCVGLGRVEAFVPFLGMLEGASVVHRLNLCHTDLENRSVCALVLLCRLYLPSLHILDLRDNPRLGDTGGLALRRLAATQPGVHAIRLEGTSVAVRIEREIRALLHHNRKGSHSVQDTGSAGSHTHGEHSRTLT